MPTLIGIFKNICWKLDNAMARLQASLTILTIGCRISADLELRQAGNKNHVLAAWMLRADKYL